ncbi:MAG: carboxymuconolactone decarboxylase family protein [Calothrix sp. FI2-JRJ7]|jgi:alkylhydroperoxidase family enzyme|nr:carboxymuconolactone decarboxylase family protein [Calothrix sp. FI2-JRJ7]
MEFTVHTIETAPEASKEMLAHAQATFGLIPNLEGILASAPAVLKGGMVLWDLFETTSFTPTERQVIYLTANYVHECHYCMAAHSALAASCMLPSDIDLLRDGKILKNPKLQALQKFTRRLIEARGWLEDKEVEEFINSGYTKQQVLEVILGVAIKVIHNYTNHIAKTTLDKQFQPFIWDNREKHM